ncbi:MAG: flippase-like domain-containing protein [Ignavibacteria bacterium]|nr:flippase-like domain-containing protein [Ignavibacteria bacterium]
MNRHPLLRLTVALMVLTVALWWLSTTIDINVVGSILNHVDIRFLIAGIPFVLLSHVVRTIRWRRLLRHLPNTPGIAAGFSSILIGYAASMIIPRSGEVLRPYVLAQRTGIRFPTVLSSVVLERIIDVMSLFLGIALLIIVRSDLISVAFPGISTTRIILSIAIPLVSISVVIGTIAFSGVGPRIVDAFMRPISSKAAGVIQRFLNEVKIGMQAVRSVRTWLLIASDSVIMWTLYAIPLFAALLAMPWNEHAFTLLDGGVLLLITSVGVTIAPTPGALGIYQGFAQTALIRLYGATPNEGFVFGVIAWVLNYGTAFLVGSLCFLIEMKRGMRLRNVSREA